MPPVSCNFTSNLDCETTSVAGDSFPRLTGGDDKFYNEKISLYIYIFRSFDKFFKTKEKKYDYKSFFLVK